MPYTGVYVFGDSLVDAGNALKLAEWYGDLTFSDLPDGAPDPELGYFDGRFADGYTFADLIANKAIGTVTEPVFPYGFEDPWLGIRIAPWEGDPSGNNLNFAYGGAQVRQGDEVVQDLDSQTDTFRDAVDGRAPPGALYIVTMGGNDVRNLAPVTGTPQPPVAGGYAALDKVVQQLINELGQLINDGARSFLITGCADVGMIPDYDIDNDDFLDASEQMRSDTATAYSQYLDLKIQTVVIPALQARGATVTFVSMMDGLDAIMPTIEALNNLAPGTLTTDSADHHQLLLNREAVFFDDIHPNGQVHALFGSYAQALLTGTAWVETLPLMGAEVDGSLTASIATAGEVDSLNILTVAGTQYRFDLLGMSSIGTAGSLADPSLRLLSANGTLVASDDDSGAGFDATLTFSAASTGTVTAQVSATGSVTGSYVFQAAVVGGTAMLQGNTYTVSSAATLVIEGRDGAGTDIVRTSVSYALLAGSEIEVLRTTNDKGKGALNLTGNEFDQTLVGNAGGNTLDGRGGNDTLTGGAGKDVFVLGTGGIDTITDYGTGDLVDIGAALKVAAGTNVVGGGYLRVTSGGLIQVDADGGGDEWVTLGSVNGSSAVTLRYVADGSPVTVSVARTSMATAATTSSMDGAVTADAGWDSVMALRAAEVALAHQEMGALF